MSLTDANITAPLASDSTAAIGDSAVALKREFLKTELEMDVAAGNEPPAACLQKAQTACSKMVHVCTQRFLCAIYERYRLRTSRIVSDVIHDEAKLLVLFGTYPIGIGSIHLQVHIDLSNISCLPGRTARESMCAHLLCLCSRAEH